MAATFLAERDPTMPAAHVCQGLALVGPDSNAARQRPSVAAPTPTLQRHQFHRRALRRSNRAAALLLNDWPYPATVFPLRVPLTYGFIEATTIATLEVVDEAVQGIDCNPASWPILRSWAMESGSPFRALLNLVCFLPQQKVSPEVWTCRLNLCSNSGGGGDLT